MQAELDETVSLTLIWISSHTSPQTLSFTLILGLPYAVPCPFPMFSLKDVPPRLYLRPGVSQAVVRSGFVPENGTELQSGPQELRLIWLCQVMQPHSAWENL